MFLGLFLCRDSEGEELQHPSWRSYHCGEGEWGRAAPDGCRVGAWERDVIAPASRILMQRVIRVSGGRTGRLLSGILPRSFAWGETSLSHETHTHRIFFHGFCVLLSQKSKLQTQFQGLISYLMCLLFLESFFKLTIIKYFLEVCWLHKDIKIIVIYLLNNFVSHFLT